MEVLSVENKDKIQLFLLQFQSPSVVLIEQI